MLGTIGAIAVVIGTALTSLDKIIKKTSIIKNLHPHVV